MDGVIRGALGGFSACDCAPAVDVNNALPAAAPAKSCRLVIMNFRARPRVLDRRKSRPSALLSADFYSSPRACSRSDPRSAGLLAGHAGIRAGIPDQPEYPPSRCRPIPTRDRRSGRAPFRPIPFRERKSGRAPFRPIPSRDRRSGRAPFRFHSEPRPKERSCSVPPHSEPRPKGAVPSKRNQPPLTALVSSSAPSAPWQ